MIDRSIVEAWDQAPGWRIHPTREHQTEVDYWASGRATAADVAQAFPNATSVLDFGCGDGRVSIALADLGYDVIGADSSPNHLARLTDARVRTVLTDGTDLAGDIGTKVDAAVCVAVLIHYDYASGYELMSQLAHAVREGGVLVVDAPLSGSPREAGWWIGVTTWDESDRDGHLRSVGFERMQSDSMYAVYRRT